MTQDCQPPKSNSIGNLDPPKQNCTEDIQFTTCEGVIESELNNSKTYDGLDIDTTYKQRGLGYPPFCDPMTTGQIVEDHKKQPLSPDISVVYRYAQGLRGANEAVKGLFENVVVIAPDGKVLKVPIVWGPGEKAVEAAIGPNVRKDNTGVVDRITIPIMSIYNSSMNFPWERYMYHGGVDWKRGEVKHDKYGNRVGNPSGSPSWTIKEKRKDDTVLGTARGIPVSLGYTLSIWTMFIEDMHQILEQVITKFSRFAYIRVQGVSNWEVTVAIDSVTSNIDTEPGDANQRVIKYQINLTAESYIPQPIVRRKSVHKTKIEFIDSIDEKDIRCVLDRIESTIGDFNI